MKKQVIKEQLVIDGIAQIKTKRQMINQGILTKNGKDFNRVEYNPNLMLGMLPSFGKILKVAKQQRSNKTCLIGLEDYYNWPIDYNWPIECIAK